MTVPAPLSTAGGGTEATALRVTVATDSTGVLSVDDNGGSLTVDGTVTANAGTNLNTSALALETGGNLAAAAASLSVIDDWDETDRAKVNIIAGQVGVQGGSGTINALTQRVVLATDQPTVPVSMAAGGTTQYDEDTASTAADKVTMAGVVRKDTAATLVDTDGDRTQLEVDANGRLHVNGSGVTQPVSAASLPLPSGASTSALQTQPGVDIGDVTINNAAGASAVNVQDGGNSLTVDGSVSVSGAVDTELPAAAALADNTSNPTVPAVGSFLMAFDGTNWDRVQTGAATGGALKVDGSAVTQPVSGTVTANAGTNLNTSALATESGGNLAAAAASLSVLDDWDETDRAKVNPIVGIAGVAAGSGASSTSTQRVILATDDPAVTALQIIDDWDETDRAKVNPIVGQAGIAAGAGATGATVTRTVTANGDGKTILSAGGSAASSGNNTLVAAGTNRLKVIAFSLTTLSTTAMTCIFQSGASGTELWRVVIQAPTGVSAGANLSTTVPGWLFATASATLLNLNLSSANAVHWSVSYYDEA